MLHARPVALLALLALLVCAGAPALRSQEQEPAAERAEPAKPVTVFFLRHAEKGDGDPADPGLSAEGEARALALSRLLERAGVTHLFASEFRRTQATLAPLAERVGLEVTVIGARDAGRQLETLVNLTPGSVAVVAGHSNTVPAMVRALRGAILDLEDSPHGRILREDEYDRLFVVTLPVTEDALVQTIELRYGS